MSEQQRDAAADRAKCRTVDVLDAMTYWIGEAERLRGENEHLKMQIAGLQSALADDRTYECPYCDGSGEVCESCLQPAADCECEATGKVMCIECEGTGVEQEL